MLDHEKNIFYFAETSTKFYWILGGNISLAQNQPRISHRYVSGSEDEFSTVIGLEAEFTWHFGHCLTYCNSSGWWMVAMMMNKEQSVE
jgi:hypothetical protein